ncbi:hypothetical protein [Planctomycetes bacterium TBK1r]|uniref:Uncharacterized protein n=1 Tax=Stieleria magnilauensis TaxID=2527963 RepID=A0ABX5XGW8_9BACT|nr:hypothetical protein TBK1r_01630 [Planctomycetes bacterium TBK1r]
MDPDQTFTEMLDAFGHGDYEGAAEHANNLAHWLNRGGFPPVLEVSTRVKQTFTVSDQLAREFCHAACRLVLDQHETGCDLDFTFEIGDVCQEKPEGPGMS